MATDAKRHQCVYCGSTENVERLADLASGEPYLVCRECTLRQARDALVAELRREGKANLAGQLQALPPEAFEEL